MRVMVIGGGGREHALAKFLAASPHVHGVICVPGNAGTAGIPCQGTGGGANAGVSENFDLPLHDHAGLVTFARRQGVDLTVVGPEGPLCEGVVDRFEAAGLRVFGPRAAAARIEGDKAHAKRLMKAAHVPTAEARIFNRYDAAKEYVATRDTGVVVKASGLAAGKGVVVCEDPADGLLALEQIMEDRVFGDAGSTVVVEELLKGEELSVFALVDGHTICVLETAQDHKAVGEGDTGANTGGMGAYSPAPSATEDLMGRIERDVLVPIVDAMIRDDTPFRGLLYTGLMLTPGGPKVLEFNCRFGDPEAQVILPRLQTDLYELLSAVVDGRLDTVDLRWRPDAAVGVVMASGGYPGRYETGKVIEGLGQAEAATDVHVFHAGTRRVETATVTAGGRVLCVTGLGQSIASARDRAYRAVEQIQFDHAYYRRDIAHRALARS